MTPSRMTILCGLFTIAAAGTAQDSAPARIDDSVRIRYEHWAGTVTVIQSSEILYGRPVNWVYSFLRRYPEPVRKAWADARRDIEDRTIPVESLVKLTRHENPKVRTLASFALFAREDHMLLPAIVPLCSDEAETFVEAQIDPIGGKPLPPKPSQVRWIAMELVGFWLNHSNARADRFAEYWEPRKARPMI